MLLSAYTQYSEWFWIGGAIIVGLVMLIALNSIESEAKPPTHPWLEG